MIHRLEADGIQLDFGGRNILSGIYILCETGKITGLLGRNGAGKSCLMRVVFGALKCEKSVRIDKHSYYEPFKHSGLLAYLPQFNFIPGSLSIKRVFDDFGLDFQAFTLLFPELVSAYKSQMKTLSGGERRIVEIYSIVKSRTLFALLDEPFTQVSPLQTEKLKALLIEEKKNKGILLTDHIYREVIDLSDNLYLLSNGRTHLIKDLSDIEAFGYARS